MTDSTESKLCINCIYILSDYYAQGAYRCNHTLNIWEKSLVTGRDKYIHDIEYMREEGTWCGKEAKLFQEKARVHIPEGSFYNPASPVPVGETLEERLRRLNVRRPGSITYTKSLRQTTADDI